VRKEQADAVVIGAGLGGLSAAAYLAKAGKRVLVLEHHAVPGGYAHEFRRGKFRFEVALHALDGVAPGGWTHSVFEDLGILDQVEFNRLDPYYTAKFPNHVITAHLDPAAYEAELARQFPHETEGLRRLCQDMKAVYM
jgi:phytoene dehydrogenase-like protein